MVDVKSLYRKEVAISVQRSEYGKSLTAEDMRLELEGKMRCGVVETSQLLITVKGSGDLFVR